MCLTIFSPDIWPGEGFSYCLRICSGATRILTEWSPSLYRDDALSIVNGDQSASLDTHTISSGTAPQNASGALISVHTRLARCSMMSLMAHTLFHITFLALTHKLQSLDGKKQMCYDRVTSSYACPVCRPACARAYQ